MATITQIQQPAKFIQPGLTTVTTTTPVDSGYANAQVAKTVAVSNTNAVFAVLGLLMGIALTVLNAIPIASGTRVYGGAYAKDPNSYDPGLYPSHNANYYPGFWYGLLVRICVDCNVLTRIVTQPWMKTAFKMCLEPSCLETIVLSLFPVLQQKCHSGNTLPCRNDMLHVVACVDDVQVHHALQNV